MKPTAFSPLNRSLQISLHLGETIFLSLLSPWPNTHSTSNHEKACKPEMDPFDLLALETTSSRLSHNSLLVHWTLEPHFETAEIKPLGLKMPTLQMCEALKAHRDTLRWI